MTAGLAFISPSTGVPNPAFPYANVKDKRLTPGSLFLVEPSHSRGGLASGSTAYGALPNVAWEECAALIGGGDATTLAATFSGDAVDGARGVFQRSAKGGLHCIVSGGARASWRSGIELPLALYTWWLAGSNKSRAHALFIWSQITRTTATSTTNLLPRAIGSTSSVASNNLDLAGIPNVLGTKRETRNAPTGWNGSPHATPASNRGGYFFGNSPSYSSLNQQAGISVILYSYHLIDVAASGKTFAQLDADDLAAYNQAFGAGGSGVPAGRFYNDSWADPASVIAT